MSNEKFELDKLLARQLRKLNLSVSARPSSDEQWAAFLSNVNAAYRQSTQDRYLIERSLTLASQEMAELNEKIENAQLVSGFGYWSYNKGSQKVIWSRKIYDMLGLNYADGLPTYGDIVSQYVHADDSLRINNKVQNALLNGEDYEDEIRLLNQKDQRYYWFYVKGHPHPANDRPDEYVYLSGIMIDITKSKESEIKIANLNKELIISARQAGMTEVAISVLHNIGNVLNSLNVSTELVIDRFDNLKTNHLEKVVTMLNENNDNLLDFLTQDKKGKLLPHFLNELIKVLKDDLGLMVKELVNIKKYSNHMREIITKQQNMASLSTLAEEFTIQSIVDDAIQISMSSNRVLPVKVICDNTCRTVILADKHKILQVLINIIRNAVDAHIQASNTEDSIEIHASYNGGAMDFVIKDRGVGISPEDINDIFTFGFTTKKDGHGYGLHNCALIVKDLNGTLTVSSEGDMQGAEFRLRIPVEKAEVD